MNENYSFKQKNLKKKDTIKKLNDFDRTVKVMYMETQRSAEWQ